MDLLTGKMDPRGARRYVGKHRAVRGERYVGLAPVRSTAPSPIPPPPIPTPPHQERPGAVADDIPADAVAADAVAEDLPDDVTEGLPDDVAEGLPDDVPGRHVTADRLGWGSPPPSWATGRR